MRAEVTDDRRLTVLGTLDRVTATLARSGIERPRREATRLVADLLDVDPAELMLRRGSIMEPERRRWIERAARRRASGEPLPYVTGLAGFRHLTLRSDARALIPRPETEGLVDRVLALASAGRVLDVGTGTGCLALSLRHEGTFERVVAIDCSADALALAAHNARRTGLPIDLVRGDLTDGVATGSVDVLVSNPPYLSESEYLALDSSVARFEPRVALASGTDGLDATRALLQEARRVLRPGGVIVLEIAAERPRESADAARAAGLGAVRVEPDLFDRPRYLTARQES